MAWIFLVTSLFTITNSLNTVDCSGGCAVNIIQCPSGDDCLVTCNANSACQNSDIGCPDGYECTVQCTSTYSCHSAAIWASGSSKLTVEGCTAGHSCWYIKISCPPTTESDINKNCIIYGGNEFHGTSLYPLVFKAYNSWDDFDLTNVNTDTMTGTMNCYTDSCSFSGSFWCQCGPTDSPTNFPTTSPSNIPTISPTQLPTDTTQTPTNYPSPAPIHDQSAGAQSGSSGIGGGYIVLIVLIVLTVIICTVGYFKWARNNAAPPPYIEPKTDVKKDVVKQYDQTGGLAISGEIEGDIEGEGNFAASAPGMDMENEGNEYSVRNWFKNNVKLRAADVEEYCQIFIQNGFDTIPLIKEMTEQEMKEIGIVKMGHRKQILQAIVSLQSGAVDTLQ